MPNTRQAKKDLRQAHKAAAANSAVRVALHKIQKEIRLAVEAKDKKKAGELALSLQKMVDKAAQKNVVHWKKAARKKSRIAAQLARLK